VQPHSSYRCPRHDICTYQYGQPNVVFANTRVECSTIRTAATIELGILILSLVGIKRASQDGKSRLAQLLVAQGTAYFVVVLILQMLMIASGLVLLKLTSVDNSI
jgi:hypothetical protein